MALHLRNDFGCDTGAAHSGGVFLHTKGVVLLFAFHSSEHQDLVEDGFRFQASVFSSVFAHAPCPLTLRLEDAARDAGLVVGDPGNEAGYAYFLACCTDDGTVQ